MVRNKKSKEQFDKIRLKPVILGQITLKREIRFFCLVHEFILGNFWDPKRLSYLSRMRKKRLVLCWRACLMYIHSKLLFVDSGSTKDRYDLTVADSIRSVLQNSIVRESSEIPL